MYDKELLFSLLVNEAYKTVDSTGKVLPPSHSVFKALCQKMTEHGSSITSKHLHTIVNNNRNGAYDVIIKAFNICTSEEFDISKNKSIETITYGDESRCYTKDFHLVISPEQWALMKPEKKNYCGRRYVTLKSGKWSNIIADRIWDQTQCECCFSFKYGKVYVSAEAKCYAKFIGRCKECGATLRGMLYQKPCKKRDVIFECTIAGLCPDVVHKRKRQLKGYLRQEVASALIDGRKDAIDWRVEEAKDLMQFGDKEPSTLYNCTVLRKAKQQEMENRLQLHNTDPVSNLQIAKYNRCIHAIHAIGADPFFCLYWSKEQCLLYRLRNEDGNRCMIIDATGGIAKKLKLPNGEKTSHIFLYQCMSLIKTGSVPVFQLVSTKQDAAMITYFLLEIRRSGAPVPQMVISDFGRAILIAVARAFADCGDLRHYLQMCYDVLFSGNTSALPRCYIRLDVSHIIAMIARWECLRNKPLKVRQFYLRCLAHAYKIRYIDELEKLLESMLIVALSEEIGRGENNEPLPSELSLRYANQTIKGTVIEDSCEENDDKQDDEHTDAPTSWTEWSNTVYRRAQTEVAESKNGDVINAFYNPAAAAKITNLMAYLPLWTGIMRSFFNIGSEIATSSSVEAEFSNLKCRAFKGSLPMRVDKFVIRHLDYLDGKLRLAHAKLQDSIEIIEMSCDEEDKNSDYSSIENWRNKQNESKSKKCSVLANDKYVHASAKFNLQENNDVMKTICEEEGKNSDYSFVENCRNMLHETKSKKCSVLSNSVHAAPKLTYLSDCPDWDFVQTTNVVSIPLIKNGSICNPVRIGKKHMIIRETCAFDSLVHIIAHALAMYQSYASLLKTSNNAIIQFAKGILTRGKVEQGDYTKRATILCSVSIFEISSYTRQFNTLNGNCNVVHLAEHLFDEIPSYERIQNCNMCQDIISRPSITLNINVDLIIQHGMQHLQESIDDIICSTNDTCRKCNNSCKVTYKYGPHLIIDTSVMTDSNYTKMSQFNPRSHTLDSIPKSLMIDSQAYGLAGVIDYIQFAAYNGHYTAYLYAGLTWYKYDDLVKKRSSARPEQEITPHSIIYVKE